MTDTCVCVVGYSAIALTNFVAGRIQSEHVRDDIIIVVLTVSSTGMQDSTGH